MMRDAVKRTVDIAIAAAAMILLAPIQALVAALVAIFLGRPVLFRQVRPGLNGEPFEMRKFRSMRAVDPERGLVSDTDRLTPFGQRLRSTSLDELPTLWNVLRGDMSLVGPRPLLTQYMELYSPEQARRHEVRPGLTGLAQVSGRNDLPWIERLALDVNYVDTRSTLLDFRILRSTTRIVARREGITESGSVTMTMFKGER